MKKINLAITGCMGRMGQQIIKSSKLDGNFKIVALTENKTINKMINGVKITLNTEQILKKADLIIDFTTPQCTLQVLNIASKIRKRVVIGTTGFSKKDESLIKKFSRKIPILKAGNMSLGINLLMYLTEIASSSLGKKYLTKINLFRSYLSDKMNQLNDEFPASSWYLKNWIQDRNIKRTATM